MDLDALKLTGVSTDEVIARVSNAYLKNDPGGAQGAALDKFVWEHSKGSYESMRALQEELIPEGSPPAEEKRRFELAEWACSLKHQYTYRLISSSWYSASVPATDIGDLVVPQKGWGDRWGRVVSAGLPPTVKYIGELLYKDIDSAASRPDSDRAFHVVNDLELRIGALASDIRKFGKENPLVAVKLKRGPTLFESDYTAIFLWKHAAKLIDDVTLYLGFPRPFVVKKKKGVFPMNLDPDDQWLGEVL